MKQAAEGKKRCNSLSPDKEGKKTHIIVLTKILQSFLSSFRQMQLTQKAAKIFPEGWSGLQRILNVCYSSDSNLSILPKKQTNEDINQPEGLRTYLEQASCDSAFCTQIDK